MVLLHFSHYRFFLLAFQPSFEIHFILSQIPTCFTSRMPPGSGGAPYWGCIFILKNCPCYSPSSVQQLDANISHLEIPQRFFFYMWMGNEAHYGLMQEPRQEGTTKTIKEAPQPLPHYLSHNTHIELIWNFFLHSHNQSEMHIPCIQYGPQSRFLHSLCSFLLGKTGISHNTLCS